MTESAAILTITATIPAGSTGTFTLDAEFVAAPDGSGTTYTPRVDSTPVTVKGAACTASMTALTSASLFSSTFFSFP